MKYIYDGPGGCRTFRGYFFWNKRPVNVTDRATLAAIEREPDFRRVEDETQEPQRQEGRRQEEVLIPNEAQPAQHQVASKR